MSLENIVVDEKLEKNEYHLLDRQELEALSDAESIYERGRRLLLGADVIANPEKALSFIYEAARLGHAVALAVCYQNGKGAEADLRRAWMLYQASADRGHAAGKRFCAFVLFVLLCFVLLWFCALCAHVIHSTKLYRSLLSQL